MRKLALLFACLSFAPSAAHAQGAAAEMFGVREVIIDYARFNDAKAAATCGLSREQVAADLDKTLKGTGVPAIPVLDAKPPVLGVARIELVPEIALHTDENLDCVAWITLTAQNRVNAVIQPVATLRGVTVVYWQQKAMVASSQSLHEEKVSEVIQKMAAAFAQQYRIDQPPDYQQK